MFGPVTTVFSAIARVCLGTAAGVLLTGAAVAGGTTTPADVSGRPQRSGEPVVVAGMTGNVDPATGAYELSGGDGSVYVIGSGEPVATPSIVLARGHRARTDAGRGVLAEEGRVAVKLDWADVPAMSHSAAPRRVLFPSPPAAWMAAATALLVVMLFGRALLRVLAVTFLLATAIVTAVAATMVGTHLGLVEPAAPTFVSACGTTVSLCLTAIWALRR